MLATQLARTASLNANFLQNKKNVESYLFTQEQARHHDLDAVYQLAQNGLELLSVGSKHLKTLKSSLLTPSSRFTDRTMLSKEENAAIDEEVETLLFAISPFLMEQAASKVVEWLVRRFRVNEFNVDAVLTVFLPYHATAQFVKMVSILRVPDSSLWSFLNVHKKALTPVYRDSLVKEMLSNHFLANFIVNILEKHVQAKQEHRAVINFALSTNVQYIALVVPDRVHISPLLLSFTQAMTKSRSIDVVSASILLLGHLSSRVALSKDVLESILTSLTSLKVAIDPKTLISGISLILQRQNSLSRLPDPLFDAILRLLDTGNSIEPYVLFLTSLGFLSPLCATLCSKIEAEPSTDILLALTTSEHLSREGTQILCSTVIQAAVKGPSPVTVLLRPVLSRMYQLFPEELRSAAVKIQKDEGIIQTEEIEALLSSLLQPMGTPISQALQDELVLASSSDPFLRAQGIQSILGKDIDELTDDEENTARERTKDLLLSLFSESESSVLETLYSSPTKISQILGVESILERLEIILAKSHVDIPFDVFTRHAQFLLDLEPDNAANLSRIDLIIGQQLLVTKANFKRATFVRRQLQSTRPGILDNGLLAGVRNLFDAHWESIKGNTEGMSAFNEKLIHLLAENINKAAHYDQIIAYLLATSRRPDALSKQFSCIVLFTLLSVADDTKKLSLGVGLVRLLRDVDPTTSQFNGTKHMSQIGVPTIDFTRVVSKSGHHSTLARVYSSILLQLSTLPKPSADLIVWVGYHTSDSRTQIVTFWLEYYSLLLCDGIFETISTIALRKLFLTLQYESLPLLVLTWANPSIAQSSRVAALRHTEALFKALTKPESSANEWDFQLMFPLLLAVLCDPSEEIRFRAIACLRLVVSESRAERKGPVEIFGLSSMPDSTLGALKFLDMADFRRYTNSLFQYIDSIQLDAEAVARVHGEMLQPDETEPSKLTRYKQRVLSYLFSHACAWPNPNIRMAILESTSAVETASRLPLLYPLVIELSKNDPMELLVALQPSQRPIYVDRLLHAIKGINLSQVETDMNMVLPPLFAILKTYAEAPEEFVPLQGIVGTLHSLTNNLGEDHCLHLCRFILSLDESSSHQTALLQLLSAAIREDSVLSEILKQLQLDMVPERPSKRARTDSVSPLTKLLVLCHAITLSSSPRSSGVLGRLLANLECTMEIRGLDPTEIAHAQGVIINTVLHVSQHVPETDNKEVQLRIDVVVTIIKDSCQPHLVHQALLLVAALVPWSSESLIHHLMPILLSTGSYVSPRDDAYSARVAEKTVDSVMPILAAYLRQTYPKRSLLQIAARPYIAIFTDSATNIPSHRRTRFFVHLISVLGFADFLNPTCLLLLEPTKSTGEGKKIQTESFKLAISLFESQKAELRLALLSDLLEDVLANVSTSVEENANLLSSLKDGTSEHHNQEHDVRLNRIVQLVGHCIRHWSGPKRLANEEHAQRLLSTLARLLAAFDGITTPENPEQLHDLLKAITTSALGLLSASTMLFTCLQLLRSNDAALQAEMFDILASRLPDVGSKQRAAMSRDLILLVTVVQDTINSSVNTRLTTNAIRALQAIAQSAQPSELTAITQLVPVVESRIVMTEVAPSAITALNTLCVSIGPRIVPYLSSVIKTCCTLLRKSDAPPKTFISTTSLLRTLVDTTSPFWTVPDVEEFVLGCILTGNNHSGEVDGVRSLEKRASRLLPRHIFFSALKNTQELLHSRQDAPPATVHEQLFSLLAWSIKSSRQSDIETESRTLLAMMIRAWDKQQGTLSAIRAFVEMTVKLNEHSFNPLHRILFDWAWVADDDSILYSKEHKAICYCQIMSRLMQVLRALITPYLTAVITRGTETLDLWSQAPAQFEHEELWRGILEIIDQSVNVDDGALWNDDLARPVSAMLVRQIPLTARSQKAWMTSLLCAAISAVASVVTDPILLKTLNLDFLMQTRSEEAAIRICSLQCVAKLWLSNGRRLAGWKHETLPFLHECAEDENEDVASESKRVKGILDQL
ncbi:snoRNA-binding rRNA-processing protein utp10 [Serendipita sp. 411]|nr:snoRNA-binding rRNA-processing protein utp10 [Serendipita sp. 411]